MKKVTTLAALAFFLASSAYADTPQEIKHACELIAQNQIDIYPRPANAPEADYKIMLNAACLMAADGGKEGIEFGEAVSQTVSVFSSTFSLKGNQQKPIIATALAGYINGQYWRDSQPK